ncbi:HAMP domain-containing sensor histidine kinase [Nitrosomonas sp.]|uniref:sensor histidine kinase n=1 Tax=Nitrosomonas sp. TaxID=42353 RepID=UPI001E06CE02|nr:HAMP domain-containing sensor histidine kinase [Nitrosomonas sp.]MCB1950256.1 HAMP domain-containing histidine kinase [Nitrosomonas sp.]MCP5242911.1 HAMP domain-containing histidine kinase [Burkholderiales bacterium]MCP5291566.1 HAMP domain-containing histidine kinase [Burkholderiales bacterium]MDR4515456.1 HAMP domain-containing histidine kinase [Nitrosomonas sp.]
MKTNSIAQRITLAFLAFGALLTLMLGVSQLVGFNTTVTSMLDDILYAELKHFREQTPNVLEPGYFRSRTTTIYISPINENRYLPAHVRDLSLGIHDLTYNDRDYHVLVEDIDNNRYIVKFDETNIHELKNDFFIVVWICSVIILILALVIGWIISFKIVRPIKQLANQVVSFKNKPEKVLELSEFGDDEIGALAKELQHYHNQLRLLLIREKEFASSVSHELRTPITSISLAAEILSENDNLSTVERKRIDRIQRAVNEMTELIETFLALARINIDSDENYCQREMGPIVQRVIEQQRIWLSDKPVEVNIVEKGPLKVSAPFGILNVLVANLVRNAFRYTEQGKIKVLLTPDRLTVTDTGIGIDECTQDQLFKCYIKKSACNMEKVGLGLMIVYRICEKYNWTVSFKSSQNRGSQFTIRFADAVN